MPTIIDAHADILVVIPAYNREATLEKAVMSVLRQTYAYWTLMIVDDNSIDSTPRIIEDLIEKYPRIKAKKNCEFMHSAAGARNSGILERGQYPFIAFLDSDDTWPPHHLETQVTHLKERKEIDIVFGDLQRVAEDGRVIINSKFTQQQGLPASFRIKWDGDFGLIANDGLLTQALKYRWVPGLHTSVLRANVFDDLQLESSLRIGEDYLFTLECINNGFRFGASKKIHLHYLIHEANLSSVAAKDLRSQVTALHDEERLLTELIPSRIPLTRQQRRILRLHKAELYAWQLSELSYLENAYASAIKRKILAVRLSPTNILYWKTLWSIIFRILLRRVGMRALIPWS
ncbi:MAG: glycosyltransferase [Pseudomonadales bacterium]|nr:glycosyltransferase [Pseudomonadales bacterium]